MPRTIPLIRNRGRACKIVAAVVVSGSSIVAGPVLVGAAGGDLASAPRSAGCASYRADYAYPIQRCGRGEAVRIAQVALRHAGYAIAADGYFGPRTHAALSGFQRSSGLSVTGEIDERTWVALTGGHTPGHDADGDGIVDPWEAGGTAPQPPRPGPSPSCDRYVPADRAYPIRRCERGWFVSIVQNMLADLGYDVATDAYFGPQTERAVREFQAGAGLAADGLVGPRTWAALSGRFPPLGGGTDPDGNGIDDPWEHAADCFVDDGRVRGGMISDVAWQPGSTAILNGCSSVTTSSPGSCSPSAGRCSSATSSPSCGRPRSRRRTPSNELRWHGRWRWLRSASSAPYGRSPR
jgi:peptidoglycan hydrolase-like protein with peptidoglycan-binding domain